MNDIFEILEEVIERNPFRIYPDKGAFSICEKAEGASGKSVTLKTTGKVFAFSLDQDEDRHFRVFNALSALYPKNSEEKRLTDAMLLAVPR